VTVAAAAAALLPVALLALAAAVAPARARAGPSAGLDDGRWRWRGSAAVGFDTYSQTYYPAEQDTTEVVSELTTILAGELSRRPYSGHRWRLRPELALGTERTRERLEVDHAWRAADGTTLLRSDLQAEAVHYVSDSDYNLTSDSVDLRGKVRWFPGARGRVAGELRLQGEWLDYRRPSSLELDRREGCLGAYLVQGRDALDRWRLGGRLGRRVHPDSSEIDRTVAILEASYDHNAFEGVVWRAAWRSERRRVDEPLVRPSSWNHWLDAELELPVGEALRLALSGTGEWWRYDREQGAYTDQSRGRAVLALKGGGWEGPSWEAGLAAETLDSHTEGESYHQLGLRLGSDWFGQTVSGSLLLEVGKRDYDESVALPGDEYDDLLLIDEPLYTDFTYLELWLTGTWRLDRALELDAMASYLPESHDREIDDQKLGFASIRLTYRF